MNNSNRMELISTMLTDNVLCSRTTTRLCSLITSLLLTLVLLLALIPDFIQAANDVTGEEVFHTASRVQTLTISDRGYQDVVIALKDEIKENEYPMLIDELKRAFTRASEFMYRATRSLAHFKTVRILIPSTWLNTSDLSTATWERYDTSDVRISQASENFPYTEKFTGCGLPGKYISLTPDYVVNKKDGVNALHDIYGTPNKVIVHEWGHYRWGLFDEYPRYAPFYQDVETGSVEATRCVLAIPGEIRNIHTGEPCGEGDLDSDGLPDSTKCVFFDDMNSKHYSASIMYKQYLSNNEQYCDDPGRLGVPNAVAHNPMAPNEQNDKCSHRSAWEVLRAHPDFAGTERLDPKPVASTVPEFIILRQKPQTTTVLVLDTSGSMDGQRLILLQQAAANIIENVLPLGSRLGIVMFAEYANLRHRIVEIDSATTRSRLVSSLPTSVAGQTSIGAGVQLAVQELHKEEDSAGSTLIVITDGEQNSHPYIQDILDQVTNLTVNTIAVGGDADTELEVLSDITGGDSFSHSDGSSEIYLSFFKAAAAQMTSSQIADTVIDADFTLITVPETFTNRFYLDEALTGGLKIRIAYIENEKPSAFWFDLHRPDGEVINSTSRNFTTNAQYKQINIDLSDEYVIAGEWTLNVTNMGPLVDELNIVIQPRAKSGVIPILATAHWAVPKITPPNRQILYVFVQEGESPVINAQVTALVRLNSVSNADNTAIIAPHDDGIGADVTKDDGIYSAYFTNFLGKGRHGVEVHVNAKDDTKLAKGARVGRSAAPNPAYASSEQIVTYEDTGAFQREITGGSFDCTSSTLCGNKSLDIYPPGRINDLTVTRVNSHTLTFRFTAPGDDLGDGNATNYEFHFSSNFTSISRQFETTQLVPSHWFIAGDVTKTKSAGAAEYYNLTLEYTDETTLIFGVVAIDDQQNRGDPSNLVTVQQPSFTVAQRRRKWKPGTIAGVVLGILTFIFCLLALFALLYKRSSMAHHKSAPKKSDRGGNGYSVPYGV